MKPAARPMRLLYVCGTYAPGAMSGSELSAHTLLRHLAAHHGVEVLVLTDERYSDGGPGERQYDGVCLRGTPHERRQRAIAEVIERFAPDVVFTQLLWADVALRMANEARVPTLFRIASVPLSLDLRHGSPLAPTAIVVASRFVAAYVQATSGRDAHVIPPSIDLARVTAAATADAERRFITMFNPIEEKGGSLFRALAMSLPERAFAVVPGWSVLRRSDGAWDEELWQRSLESQGSGPYPLPREPSFADLPNVTVLPPRQEVAEIYAQTRILCVPSRWEEPFGRVAIEAFANGIPVVATAIGGMQEHAGMGGLAIPPASGVEAWVAAIESLDNPGLYARLAASGRAAAEARFSLEATTAPWLAILRALVSDG